MSPQSQSAFHLSANVTPWTNQARAPSQGLLPGTHGPCQLLCRHLQWRNIRSKIQTFPMPAMRLSKHVPQPYRAFGLRRDWTQSSHQQRRGHSYAIPKRGRKAGVEDDAWRCHLLSFAAWSWQEREIEKQLCPLPMSAAPLNLKMGVEVETVSYRATGHPDTS